MGDEDVDVVPEPANLAERLGPRRPQVVVEIPSRVRPAKPTAVPTRQSQRLRGGEVHAAEWPGVDARAAYSGSEEAIVASIETLDDAVEIPKSVDQALKKSDWVDAMQKELDVLEKKGTWVEEDQPKGRSLIGSRWVFALKKDADGKVIKHKARLVAQGLANSPVSTSSSRTLRLVDSRTCKSSSRLPAVNAGMSSRRT